MPPQIAADDSRLYVIGDIHGRLDLLERAILAINRDVMERGGAALTVTLGDYIDRGPQSREVIECLSANPFQTSYVALKGNHEAMLNASLSNPEVARHWCRLGGLETLASFDVQARQPMLASDYDEAIARLKDALSEVHLKFFASLQTSLVVGRYFLCHAGVRPGIPLERQSDEDLLWIRNEFLSSAINFGKIVIHGHTPTSEPEVLPNRINIDTGAFSTGHLTCIVLEAWLADLDASLSGVDGQEKGSAQDFAPPGHCCCAIGRLAGRCRRSLTACLRLTGALHGWLGSPRSG